MGFSIKNILNKVVRKAPADPSIKEREKLAKDKAKDPREACK